MTKDNVKIRKKYMRDVYAKGWITSREKKYKFLGYDNNLIEYITKNAEMVEGKILEVGIGTGYPFADTFQKKGYNVYGIDISPLLINKCKRLYPDISCEVGDAENLPYKDNFFDVVYCFHSTWYFPDLRKAISEMMRVVNHKGMIIFDIQNLNNELIYKGYSKILRRYNHRYYYYYPIHFIKNVINLLIGRKGISWKIVLYEVPTNPKTLYTYFRKLKINFIVMARNKDDSLKIVSNGDLLDSFPRLVFSILNN